MTRVFQNKEQQEAESLRKGDQGTFLQSQGVSSQVLTVKGEERINGGWDSIRINLLSQEKGF